MMWQYADDALLVNYYCLSTSLCKSDVLIAMGEYIWRLVKGALTEGNTEKADHEKDGCGSGIGINKAGRWTRNRREWNKGVYHVTNHLIWPNSSPKGSRHRHFFRQLARNVLCKLLFRKLSDDICHPFVACQIPTSHYMTVSHYFRFISLISWHINYVSDTVFVGGGNLLHSILATASFCDFAWN